jgi:acetyl/propionyl-CoA carboxylase alpha subunit
MIAKLSVWSGSRPESIARMRRAIAEFQVTGITTNLSLFQGLLDDAAFQNGELHTGFLDGFLPRFIEGAAAAATVDTLVAAVLAASHLPRPRVTEQPQRASAWRASGVTRMMR